MLHILNQPLTCLGQVYSYLGQESYEYVQNHIQAVGANVKQFCSEFVQDVLYASSVDSVEETAPDSSLLHNIDSLACEKTMLNDSEDAELEFGDVNNLLRPSSMKFVGEEHLNSCLGQNVAIEMDENLKEGVMEKSRKEKLSLSEMSEPGADVEIDSSTASLPSSHHDCESELNGKVMISKEIGNNLVHTSASISSDEPSSSYVMEVASHAYKVSDVGLAPLIGSLSAESMETSDDSTTEESSDGNASIKPGMESIQPFDESYILVDGKEHRSSKKKPKRTLRRRSAKEEECEQQAASLRELDAGSKIHRRKSSTESTHISDSDSDSLDHGFSESDWEII